MSRAPAWKSSDVAWTGGRRKYDLVRELVVSGIVVGVVVLVLSILLASPDPPAVTFKEWAQQAPKDFTTTTLSEITQTSLSATYGPPYQTTAQDGATQGYGWLSPEKWFGKTIPVDPYEDFVARPLRTMPDPDGKIADALDEWRSASSNEHSKWASAYTQAIAEADWSDGFAVSARDAGPLDVIIAAQVAFAESGGLDNAIVANPRSPKIWYSSDQTFAVLYFADSGNGGAAAGCVGANAGEIPEPDTCWYYNQANANVAPRYGGYLDGGRWGVINEVGNWPGAWWMFPYSFWYQWGPGVTSQSADLYAMIMTAIVTSFFLLLPWIPGLRDIPRVTRVYRVMWSDYYRMVEREQSARD